MLTLSNADLLFFCKQTQSFWYICYCKQHLFMGMMHCHEQHWVLGYLKPLNEPDPSLAVELSVLEAPFNPELKGAPPSYSNLPCSVETQAGGGFWSFPLITYQLYLFKPLSTFWEKKLQSIFDPFGKETLREWNLRCELNSYSRVFLVKTALKQCPAVL